VSCAADLSAVLCGLWQPGDEAKLRGVYEALERARIVGVLDAWRAAAVVPRKRAYELDEHGVLFLCEWQPFARLGQIRKGFEGNPDAARAAAAKAIEAGEV